MRDSVYVCQLYISIMVGLVFRKVLSDKECFNTIKDKYKNSNKKPKNTKDLDCLQVGLASLYEHYCDIESILSVNISNNFCYLQKFPNSSLF